MKREISLFNTSIILEIYTRSSVTHGQNILSQIPKVEKRNKKVLDLQVGHITCFQIK